MNPQQLSQELREGKDPHMTRRRWIIGLSMLGGSMGQLVSMYQTGIIDHLPDPPIPHVDATVLMRLTTLTADLVHLMDR